MQGLFSRCLKFSFPRFRSMNGHIFTPWLAPLLSSHDGYPHGGKRQCDGR